MAARLSALRGLCELSGEQQLETINNVQKPVCYDAFETAGRMPIAQGLLKSLIVNKLLEEGFSVKICIDDHLSEMKRRLGGGDAKKQRAVGEYMIEVWKAIGMKVDEVEFLWSSDVMLGSTTAQYWPIMLDVTRHCDLPQIFRCMGIDDSFAVEGDEQLAAEGDDDDQKSPLTKAQRDISSADLLYPCIQCANILYAKPDICFFGSDKRNVMELLGHYCGKKPKPIALPNFVLPSLKEGQKKMSRGNAESCIFMDDEESDVKTKIKKAFCPPNVAAGNPCIELVRHVVLPKCSEFAVCRVPEYGGNKTYTNAEELCTDYSSGALHPGDLKAGLTQSVNRILQPVREHLKNSPRARELFKQVKKYKMT